ncbi:ABC transporter substrate-binding protein [Mycoplasmopsis glycophila]|uniref:ABC-type oligopeptide transport system, periplasmic component n=1 Tax=Mycoplasmopsis glycophila TaxID=171285 RepID=A0A449AWK6_9BACT|nr:ABC transporter substrate-binding protein [Mycoplasmopsis glycophila]VEU71104.1 ABC-type oligopeptide transport system, periplasmic component [Mycoplasmopsis glycophila]
MKQIKKKLFSLLLTFGATSQLAFIATACGTKEKDKNEEYLNNVIATVDKSSYDLGLATEPLNNLNYVLKQSVNKILPSLVDSFLKNGPVDSLKSILNTSKFNMVMVDTNSGKGSSNFDFYYNSTLAKVGENEKPNPSTSKLASENGYGNVLGSSYGLHDFGIFGGLGRASEGDDVKKQSTVYAFPNPKNSNNYMAATGFVNKAKNIWSNGDIVTAQDLRDYLEYILDYNNGSEKFDQIKKMSIRGAEDFANAQNEYNKKHGKFYSNPWGRRSYVPGPFEKYSYVQTASPVWESQTEGDEKEVEQIKQAALKFGFYTGQLFLDYTNEDIFSNLDLNPSFALDKEVQDFVMRDPKFPNDESKRKTVTIIKNQYVNPYQEFDYTDPATPTTLKARIQSLSVDENSFTIIFDENKTPDLNFILSHILMQLYPINRKYVETQTKGIDDYGSSPEKFLTSGPFTFDPKEVVLGPQGNITLNKNQEYYDVDNIIPNKIKILFSVERNINSIFFKDGYISQTVIPGNAINSFWANPQTKKYLKKNYGYGTIALGFNLDPESNGQSYIQDQNIRNAIYYALNREEMLKYVGWEFSFPVNNWTAYGQYKTKDGRNLEMFFSNRKLRAKNNKEYELLNYDYLVHLSKSFNFENTIREDFAFDLETARFYVEEFKKANPTVKSITLKYLNNSSDEQKKAGQYVKEKIEQMSDGFIKIEIKSLPENVFGSFYETGEFDFVYQNYDKIGGNSPQDYISAFFKRDGLNSLEGSLFGFKDNPTGDYIYADYFTKLVVDANFEGSLEKFLEPVIVQIKYVINADAELKAEFDKIYQSQAKPAIINYAESKLDQIWAKLLEKNPENETKLVKSLVKELLQYLLVKDANIAKTKLRHAAVFWMNLSYSISEIANITSSTRQRLQEQPVSDGKDKTLDLWEKVIELSFQKNDESIQAYSDRLNAFFSGNFTDLEIEQGWKEDAIFQLIGTFEKVVRENAFVVPLMEVDTNWEVTKVGGVSSLFTFDLQYAYDVTKPPRPGLPRTIGGGN